MDNLRLQRSRRQQEILLSFSKFYLGKFHLQPNRALHIVWCLQGSNPSKLVQHPCLLCKVDNTKDRSVHTSLRISLPFLLLFLGISSYRRFQRLAYYLDTSACKYSKRMRRTHPCTWDTRADPTSRSPLHHSCSHRSSDQSFRPLFHNLLVCHRTLPVH